MPAFIFCPACTEPTFRKGVESYLQQEGQGNKADVEEPSVLQVHCKGNWCHIFLYRCQIINLMTASQSQDPKT